MNGSVCTSKPGFNTWRVAHMRLLVFFRYENWIWFFCWLMCYRGYSYCLLIWLSRARKYPFFKINCNGLHLPAVIYFHRSQLLWVEKSKCVRIFKILYFRFITMHGIFYKNTSRIITLIQIIIICKKLKCICSAYVIKIK